MQQVRALHCTTPASNPQTQSSRTRLEQLVFIGIHALAVHTAQLARRGHGHQGLDDGVGGDQGHELGVDNLDLVNLARDKASEQRVGDGLGVLGGRSLAQVEGLCECKAAGTAMSFEYFAVHQDAVCNKGSTERILLRQPQTLKTPRTH